MQPTRQLSSLLMWLKESYVAFYAYSSMKIRFAAWIGAIALPAYYLIWESIRPQTYENLSLRLIGSGLCLAAALRPYWPKPLHKYELPLTYFAGIYCLPFFISFMTLMNGASDVWQLTAVASVLYIIFLYDAPNVMVASLVGVAAGLVGFLLHPAPVVWSTNAVPFLLVLFFATMSVWFFSYRESLITREKVKTAAAMAAHVAHEIRTPLASIRFEAEKLAEYFPEDASERTKPQIGTLPIAKIKTDAVQISRSVKRIDEHTRAAGVVIDNILTNLGGHAQNQDYRTHSMAATVQTAIARFNLDDTQRSRVAVDIEHDFEYRGSDVLISHVIFNLLKNGFRAIAKTGDQGLISIELSQDQGNKLICRDTGTGIPASELPYIFLPFFTLERAGTGTGVGLSFCRDILTRMNGTIECRSSEGNGTMFIVSLPDVAEA